MDKTPFAIERPGNDYSGMSFQNVSMRGQQRENSFFNGVNLIDSEITGSDLSHCELSETLMRGCAIHASNFASSDFIGSTFEHCEFVDSNFRTGEWRNAKFRSCRFVGCNFDRTTIALTFFHDCHFDDRSLRSMLHRAVSLNVFSNCGLPWLVDDEIFASRNFGTPCVPKQNDQVIQSSGTNLEQLCLLRNLGKMEVTDLLDAVQGAFEMLSMNGRCRASTFELMTLIVRAVAIERRISPTSLILMEELITRASSRIEDAGMFNIAMALVIEIRSILFDICISESTMAHDAAGDAVVQLKLKFSDTFDRETMEFLVESILTIGHFSSGAIRIEKVEHGSTYVDAVTITVVSLGPLLMALNFALRQATITVERVGQLKRAVKKTIAEPRNTRARKDQSKTELAKRAHAVAEGKIESQELTETRKLVRREGARLARLDTKVAIHVTTKQCDLR